jgi:transcription initiation factor IIE alpha subunit
MEREIRYELEFANQGGFVCYLNGERVAVAWNYADADRTLDELEAEIARLANDEPAPMPLALAA